MLTKNWRRRSWMGCLLTVVALVVSANVQAAEEPLPVVASFSILGDLTQRVGGSLVRVHTLVGADADAHVYQPTPNDAKSVGKARLMITNGLGFEGWMDRLVRASGYRGPVVVASQGVKALTMKEDHHEGHHGGHGQAADPHAWQDVANARLYVNNIAKALIAVDPGHQKVYQANADALTAELSALDARIRSSLSQVPAQRRRVVTTHDAFAYFAKAYGVEFRSPVGVSTDAEASAAGVGRLIRQIKQEKIPAVFMENISDPRLMERIRSETGARIGGTLYSDALSGPTGSASTYIKMMEHNTSVLVEALK